MPNNQNDSQPSIRSQIRQLRNQLSSAIQSQHSRQATKHLQDFLKRNCYQMSEKSPVKVAAFLSQDGELETKNVINILQQDPKFQVYLPIIEQNSNMAFGYYPTSAQLEKNRLGMMQPKENAQQPRITANELDLVLTPLVAYDSKGYRIGMGGGYYDRTFALKQKHKPPFLIGWSHSCQQVSKIDVNPWDIPLDFLITEKGWQAFNQSTLNLSQSLF